MSKVEDGAAIPKPGQGSPTSEPSRSGADLSVSNQEADSQEVMSLELALVQALRQLGKTPDNSQPLR